MKTLLNFCFFLSLFIINIQVQANNDKTLTPQEKEMEGLLKAAAQGDVESQFRIGQIGYYDVMFGDNIATDDKQKQAVHWLKKAAERDHAKAQYYLGQMYNIKIGENKKAIYWLKKAAEQDYILAQYYLGKMYMKTGENKKAVYWLEQAIERGHAQAQNLLKVVTSKSHTCRESFKKN